MSPLTPAVPGRPATAWHSTLLLSNSGQLCSQRAFELTMPTQSFLPDVASCEDTNSRMLHAHSTTASSTHATRVMALSQSHMMQVRDKQGEHRMHIACHTGTSTAIYNITLEKNARSRAAEEAVCSAAVLSIAAFHCGVAPAEIPDWPSLPGTTAIDSVQRSTEDLGDPVQALLHGRVQCVEISGPPGDRTAVVDAPRAGACILPGSFNPLHDGHKCDLQGLHCSGEMRRAPRSNDSINNIWHLHCLLVICMSDRSLWLVAGNDVSQRVQNHGQLSGVVTADDHVHASMSLWT